uniref:Uncharacterized protein n=1 Tax=Rhodnius prolixus TaxID=13249 RepID=T1HH65_RHOPR
MKLFGSSSKLALILVFVVVVAVVTERHHVLAVSSPDLRQAINVLQAQVASLIEHREQNVQLAEQLKELREEVVVLREKCRGTKNTATRLKWLESSVSEARGQISELGAALDRTTTLVTSLKSEVSANSLGLAITKK